jgi:MbtH protein
LKLRTPRRYDEAPKAQPHLNESGAKMSWEDREDTTIYKVVVNHEEQYSIWPADRENALGWNDEGKQGTKAECLDYIKEVWTDMRPLSLRRKMEEMAREPGD